MANGNVTTIRVPASLKVYAYLQQLVSTGLYGANIEEVAQTLVLQGLQRVWPVYAARFQAIADGTDGSNG